MTMPGRKYSAASGYRYGFNGKENDKDISEGGQDYGMRISDNRLGRFLSVDPIGGEFPWNSSYSYAEGNPINYIDLDGLETPVQRPIATRTATRPVINVEVDKDLLNGRSGGKVETKGNTPTFNPPVAAGYQEQTWEEPTEGHGGRWRITTANGNSFYKYPDALPLSNPPPPVFPLTQAEKDVIDQNKSFKEFKNSICCTEHVTPLVLPALKTANDNSQASTSVNNKPANSNNQESIYLVRFGNSAETKASLQTDAEKAEKNSTFGHGVSTTRKKRISGTDKNHRYALLSEVAKFFKIKPTPTIKNPNHVTVIIPKPVTEEVAKKFNEVFKPKSQKK